MMVRGRDMACEFDSEGYDCEYCDGPDYGLTDTEDQIIVFMEHHEDDYDEMAYNGHGTGWIARRGNLLYGWINEPSVRNHYWGDKCDTVADAAAVLREWVAEFRATTEYPSADDGPSIYTRCEDDAVVLAGGRFYDAVVLAGGRS